MRFIIGLLVVAVVNALIITLVTTNTMIIGTESLVVGGLYTIFYPKGG